MKNFFLIGLTGNLGSGKSTVRKMLESLGAHGIDADALARYALARGTAPWHSVVETFGWDVVKFNGEIDRVKLGTRVFATPDALGKLEAIVHPAVAALIQHTLRHTPESIVVIEAIKLIEAGLHLWCDAVWVVKCAPEVEIERVRHAREMSEADARARLAAQGSLDEKLRVANVVIDNSDAEKETRAQVQRAWDAIQPQTARDKRGWLSDYQDAPVAAPILASTESVQVEKEPRLEKIEARRATRKDLDALGAVLIKKEKRAEPFPHAELLKRFGKFGYRLALCDEKIIALAGWEAENLVATVRELWAESESMASLALPKLIALIEEEARALSCETILLLVEENAMAYVRENSRALGYQERNLSALHPTWRQVVKDRLQTGDQIWVKRLREQLVTSPI
ncbi:MAG: dephospho-CoA kinase [Chloroflexi bacterium]|nr:dephospho-CoA kinase [Chloroflexota bacterium]